MNLFVDVDDTLVLYQNDNAVNPFGYYMDVPYLFNDKLIEGVKKFSHDHPEVLIVVWPANISQRSDLMAFKNPLLELKVGHTHTHGLSGGSKKEG